jgi:hypothetical protein
MFPNSFLSQIVENYFISKRGDSCDCVMVPSLLFFSKTREGCASLYQREKRSPYSCLLSYGTEYESW